MANEIDFASGKKVTYKEIQELLCCSQPTAARKMKLIKEKTGKSFISVADFKRFYGIS